MESVGFLLGLSPANIYFPSHAEFWHPANKQSRAPLDWPNPYADLLNSEAIGVMGVVGDN